jgi:hypothetical protein
VELLCVFAGRDVDGLRLAEQIVRFEEMVEKREQARVIDQIIKDASLGEDVVEALRFEALESVASGGTQEAGAFGADGVARLRAEQAFDDHVAVAHEHGVVGGGFG